jgi:hypothetical protein
MIEFTLSIKRHINWQGSRDAFVKSHLKELIESKETLKKFGWEYRMLLFGSEDLLRKAQSLIEDEIKYCLFYQHLQTCIPLTAFERWIFVERTLKKEWDKEIDVPERWVRSNGRIQSSVIINRSGKMVKLYTVHKNDNPHLDFLRENSESTEPTHLKNEIAIIDEIERLKNEAVLFQQEHRFPRYVSEKGNFEALKDLLCVED